MAIADALAACEVARSSTEPVIFITGNAFMPPIRAYGQAEEVWQASEYVEGDGLSLWDTYVATFDQTMDDNNVLCDCPDDDNALFVVDLARWEYADEADEAETLNDQWQRITEG